MQTGEACDDGNTASGDGCSSTCQWETDCGSKNPHQTIACGETRSGSFSGTYSDVKNTICGKTFLYQDLVFVFTAQASGTVTLTYAAMPDPNDGAIFVMRGSCHSKLCVGDSTSDGQRHDVTFTAEAGVTYYIDLEAPSQQPSFNLTLSCP